MSSRRPATGPPVDAIVGTVVWVVVFALATGPLSDRIGLLEGLWLVGPLVVAPLGFSLLRPPPGPAQGLALARLLTLPAGLLVVASILAQPGALSAWLAVPWVVVTAIAMWAGLRWLVLAPSLRAKVIVPVAGLVFLALGAASLVAWRGQLRPMGLSDTRVALATVHLTFAGFGAAIVADRTRAAAIKRRPRSVAGVAGIVTVASIPVLAAGLLSDRGILDVAGSLLLSGALFVIAVVMVMGTMHRGRGAGSTALLVVSGGSVLFALVLAVQFAFGRWTGDYTLSVTRMLELHGTVSGLGFVVGGLFGWSAADVPDDAES
ncbi:MAG: YndJ family transporter [Actinomycetota bacterium]|jgi:YndJ-like protein